MPFTSTDHSSKFTNSNGRLLIKSLFVEHAQPRSLALYTLEDQDKDGFPSLFRLFLECADLTEYIFAGLYLRDWDHWSQLCESPFFRPYVARWRKELALKIRAEALARVVEESKAKGKNSFQINRWLAEQGWDLEDGRLNPRGRPKKEDVAKAANRIAAERSQVEDDFDRVLGKGSPDLQ